jgi:hypothetical protein
MLLGDHLVDRTMDLWVFHKRLLRSGCQVLSSGFCRAQGLPSVAMVMQSAITWTKLAGASKGAAWAAPST